MATALPPYVTELKPAPERRADDGLFWASLHIFPEVRAAFWPQRSFPVGGGESADLLDTVLEIQSSGLQYTVFAQTCRDAGLSVTPPSNWDKRQRLWTDLPVFDEEPCEWHYPRVQVGYNTAQVEPPNILRPEVNTPRLFGFLPNGDLLAYWPIAEALAETFDVELEAVPSSIDGRCLVVARGCDEDALLTAPVGAGTEVGILLSRAEMDQLDDACAFVEELGGDKLVLRPGRGAMFHRLILPVIQCEWELNTYLTEIWEPLDVDFLRLSGYDFRIGDTPLSRDLAIFATEQGNLVVSQAFYDFLSEHLSEAGGEPAGRLTPVVRMP